MAKSSRANQFRRPTDLLCSLHRRVAEWTVGTIIEGTDPLPRAYRLIRIAGVALAASWLLGFATLAAWDLMQRRAACDGTLYTHGAMESGQVRLSMSPRRGSACAVASHPFGGYVLSRPVVPDPLLMILGLSIPAGLWILRNVARAQLSRRHNVALAQLSRRHKLPAKPAAQLMPLAQELKVAVDNMIKRHGEHAAQEADRIVASCIVQGDRNGEAVWLAISGAVRLAQGTNDAKKELLVSAAGSERQ